MLFLLKKMNIHIRYVGFEKKVYFCRNYLFGYLSENSLIQPFIN